MPFFDMTAIAVHLLPREKVMLFADMTEEEKQLSPEVRERLSACAARWDGYVHPPLDNYDEYFENKNRCNFEDRYINRRNHLADLVMQEYFMPSGQYPAEIERLIAMICAEPTWCVPAHSAGHPIRNGIHTIELYAAETGALLALSTHLLGERLSEDMVSRIRRTVNERIFDAYLARDDYHWMGLQGQRVNNWNPWIHSNILLSALFLCEEEKYRMLVLRACALSENYVNSTPEDGLCDEGVRYWNLSTACLFDMAELVYDLTGGAVDLTEQEKLVRGCAYILGMYSESGKPANFADAGYDFYPDCPLLIRIGQRCGLPHLTQLGAHLYRVDRLRAIHDNFYRQLKNCYTASHIAAPPELQLPTYTKLDGIQIATVRKNGFFAAFKGNHNGESHNHCDVGSFVVYHGEEPVFIDPGVDLYSGHTFGPDRARIWYMRSDFHNLPVIDGRLQRVGQQYAASAMEWGDHTAACEISGAYGLAGRTWLRRMDFSSDALVITDTFDAVTEDTYLVLMMQTKPAVEGSTLRFPGGVTAVLENVRELRLEEIDITGKNPPDGLIGDAENRVTGGYSVLIPSLLTTQWKQETLYRLVYKPCGTSLMLRITAE